MKIRIYLLALMMLFTGLSVNTQAATKMTKEQAEVRASEIKQRVDEIKAMDFSTLTREQRKDLRSELKNDKKELQQLEPYIYISAGALIIIIILLILLL